MGNKISEEPRKSLIYDSLEPWHQVAIELRYKGEIYDKIALNPLVKRHRAVVAAWFVEGGLLYEAWQEYKEHKRTEREASFSAAINKLYEMALEAMLTIEIIMQKGGNKVGGKAEADGDRNRLLAAQDVLDRTIGKLQNLDITTKGMALSLSSMSYNELLAEAAKQGMDITGLSKETDI